jgi:hypothetical protein
MDDFNPASPQPTAPAAASSIIPDTRAAANEGAWLTLVNPRGEDLMNNGKPVRIKVLGKDSDAWEAVDNQQTNRRLQAGNRLKFTAEGFKADLWRKLAAITVEWEGVVLPGQTETPCTRENAGTLYKLFPDVRDQVDEFISDRANFLKPSPTA